MTDSPSAHSGKAFASGVLPYLDWNLKAEIESKGPLTDTSSPLDKARPFGLRHPINRRWLLERRISGSQDFHLEMGRLA